MVEVTDITRAASTPERKSAIIIPGTTSVAKYSMAALITRVNKPKVKMLIGKVSKIKTGLITIFKSPTTIAASKAVVKESI